MGSPGFFQSGAAAPIYIDAQAFGATGNGSTDDTVAIQNALNTGNLVFLRPGTYRVTTTLLIKQSGSGIIGAGNDVGGSFIVWDGGSGTLGNLKNCISSSGTTIYLGLLFKDLVIQNTNSGLNYVNLINCSQWSQGTKIDHISFNAKGNNNNCIYGVPPVTNFGQSPYYLSITDCDFTAGGGSTGSVGVMFDENTTSDTVPQGANANRIRGGRWLNLDVGIYIKTGQDNYVDAIDGENILNNGDLIRVGNITATKTTTVSSATSGSIVVVSAPGDTRYSGGGIKIVSGGVTQYREIQSVSGTTINLVCDLDVVPSNGDAVSMWPNVAAGNTFVGIRLEGSSGSNCFTLNPGAYSTAIFGGKTNSLGVGRIVNAYISKRADKLTPECWREPFPIIFNQGPVSHGLSQLAFFPYTFNRSLLLPGQFQILSISAMFDSSIVAGSLGLWVADNGAPINIAPDLIMGSANSGNVDGGFATLRYYPPNSILAAANSGARTFAMKISSSAGFTAAGNFIVQVMAQIVG